MVETEGTGEMLFSLLMKDLGLYSIFVMSGVTGPSPVRMAKEKTSTGKQEVILSYLSLLVP